MRQIPFSMKTLAVTALALLMAGCANDDAEQENTSKHPETKGMTEFAVVDDAANIKAAPATRTYGEYTGSSVKFYWTSGDQLWINNTAATPPLKVSSRSTIPAGGNELTAKFYFDGIYTAPTYPVRYTGNRNVTGDKVTIAATQVQQTPNDGAHIGTDGDCGTAVASRQADGSYQFMLDHKAAYLTFMPYYSKSELASTVSVTQIKVSATEDMAGTFPFDDNGIQTHTVEDPSKIITLTLSEAFKIPSTPNHAENGAIMVIAPKSYTNFTVEYTLKDSKTGVSGTVSKTYSHLTLNAGRNRPVKFDLGLERYDMKYYMWDAGKDYWDTYTGVLPIKDGDVAEYNGYGTDRYFNGDGVNLFAVNSCKICPNANEATLYAFRGDPHWDETTLWVMNGHLYTGGMWFKKLQYINTGYTSPVTTYPDGKDYRQNSWWQEWEEEQPEKFHNIWVNVPAQGKPSDISQYFYLPAMGYLDNHNSRGELKIGAYGTYLGFYNGYSGAYWTSTSVLKSNGSLQAIAFHFSNTEVGLDVDDREWGYPIFKVDGK
ncbi:MAG: hypothetical protein SOZ80_08755 [Prevotella sp.]|uniref:hypothetical protein n=1 Tax=Prevotella sp. TaxID=59823 RepID=UPI002A826281|nr:hypothetical protein [Prevotella sp.]MDY4020845.1 hypothetical protein [Prevotella sp.]